MVEQVLETHPRALNIASLYTEAFESIVIGCVALSVPSTATLWSVYERLQYFGSVVVCVALTTPVLDVELVSGIMRAASVSWLPVH